jgi:hypothetical protein
LDLICIRLNTGPTRIWLSPAVILNWTEFKITGTTTNPGVAITGSETFNNCFWAGGVEFVYDQLPSKISVLAAGSDKYLMADASLAYSIANSLDLTVGWTGKQVKLEKETTMRLTAPTLGLAVRF